MIGHDTLANIALRFLGHVNGLLSLGFPLGLALRLGRFLCGSGRLSHLLWHGLFGDPFGTSRGDLLLGGAIFVPLSPFLSLLVLRSSRQLLWALAPLPF